MDTTALPTTRSLLRPWLQRAEKRLPSLTRLRTPEALPIRLDRRRIYILPTGFGCIFGIILMVMLLGALNYNNNAALLLTCLLAATCVTSMLQTFRNLDRLELRALQAGTATAGEPLPVALHWHADKPARCALELRVADQIRHFDSPPDDTTVVQLQLPTTHRGWMAAPRILISSRWPLGCFRAWSWLAPAQQLLVYPHPEQAGPPPSPNAADPAHQRRPHGDEWAGLREYRSGDPRRHIAWKASARAGDLRVKAFDQPAADPQWRLTWDDARLADREARIARLTRWVTEARDGGHSWSLELPGQSFATARGPEHYQRCLRALAELP